MYLYSRYLAEIGASLGLGFKISGNDDLRCRLNASVSSVSSRVLRSQWLSDSLGGSELLAKLSLGP